MNPYQFFIKHAGYSHNPKTESPMQGRIRGARALARAEREARDGGFCFQWSIDPYGTSADWVEHNTDDPPIMADGSRADGGTCGCSKCEPWQTWQCAMYNSDGQIVNSLHGIDFGRDGTPWNDTYKRVVEAELAEEGLTNPPQ